MLNKIEITGMIIVKTGMHIGASDGFAAIGAIDSPVARDSYSKHPYIPGSSLKGKMRSLLAKSINKTVVEKRDDDDILITRLFGTSKAKDTGNPVPSRLVFSDTVLSNYKDLERIGVMETEAKEENTINPLTAVANPRQIERVVRGAEFPLQIIYNAVNEDEVLEDMKTLALGIKLLQYDYLGGHGSRGYGRIEIRDINADCVIGDIDDSLMDKCRAVLGEE